MGVASRIFMFRFLGQLGRCIITFCFLDFPAETWMHKTRGVCKSIDAIKGNRTPHPNIKHELVSEMLWTPNCFAQKSRDKSFPQFGRRHVCPKFLLVSMCRGRHVCVRTKTKARDTDIGFVIKSVEETLLRLETKYMSCSSRAYMPTCVRWQSHFKRKADMWTKLTTIWS